MQEALRTGRDGADSRGWSAPDRFLRFDFTFDQWHRNRSAAGKGSDWFGVMKPSTRSATVPTLRFLGAAGTVTGSKFLLAARDSCVLIDCGLFQGTKEQRLRNWDRLPVDADAIQSVVLTHAHLDHSGYLPALCRSGFKGRVFSTPETYSLCRILLPDSGHLQEEEADYANRKGYSKHAPALPLYTEEEAWKSLDHFSPVPFNAPLETDRGRVTFRPAGHILGASSILVETGEALNRRILFSGDLGRPHHPLLRAPEPPPHAHVIVVESTYGDRLHDDSGASILSPKRSPGLPPAEE